MVLLPGGEGDQHGCEGSAKLVGKDGKEIILGDIGGFGLFLGALKIRFEFFALGEIAEDEDDAVDGCRRRRG